MPENRILILWQAVEKYGSIEAYYDSCEISCKVAKEKEAGFLMMLTEVVRVHHDHDAEEEDDNGHGYGDHDGGDDDVCGSDDHDHHAHCDCAYNLLF